MEETKQQPLALCVCAELAGSFLLCFAIYAFSTWGSAVYGINIVFFALATGLAYAAVTAIFSRVSGGQLNPAITVASVLVSKTKILDGILYVIAQVIGAIAAGFAVVKLLPTSEQVAAKVWLTPAVNGFENGSVSYSLLTQYGITFSITLAIVVEVVASLIVVATAMSSQDAITLHGFLDRDAKKTFLQLIKVSGIGPKVAQSLLSTLTPSQLAHAIADNDATALAKAPGLGKKGAQKIILELKGSIDLSQIEGASAQAAISKSPVDTGTEQVVEGLISLGWRQQDAQQAVAEACAENDIPTPLATDDVPRVLRLALALMDRGR